MHLLAFFFLKDAKLISNVIQVFISLVAAAVCWHEAHTETHQGQYPWTPLSIAFLMWTIAQVAFLASLIVPSAPLEPVYDVLWLLFPFPLLLVSSRIPQLLNRDLIGWVDLAQACVFFSTLFALVFSRPEIMSISVAYEVQSLALALAFLLRFSMTQPGPDRNFYGSVTLFTFLYAIFSTVGYVAEIHGLASGTFIDLCWPLPFTVFSITVLMRSIGKVNLKISAWRPDPGHLHGVSALGLTAMSLGASGMLAFHRHVYGGVILAVSFALFAIRTSLREGQSHRFQSELAYAVLHDPLTQLGNRALLQVTLRKILEDALPTDSLTTAVLFIDVDRFKAINDDFGHSFGDALLKEVARLLRSSVRPQDTAARHGGDEFVVILNQVDLHGAQVIAQRILRTLRTPIAIEGRVAHVSASIGLAMSSFGGSTDLLLQDADCAMYRAKQAGRDRVEVFTSDMLAGIKHRTTLVHDLRLALEMEGLAVFYQPIYEIEFNEGNALNEHARIGAGAEQNGETGSERGRGNDMVLGAGPIRGFEALVRWPHAERGMISPAEFIPLAEETGLTSELGRQVLREACAQCYSWNQRFAHALSISVNVSAHQFADAGLYATVTDCLAQTGLHPSLLKLEITESVLLSGDSGVREVVSKLRKLGIAICLDDFGTGYSSLSYLLNFPIDVVKIDRSFVTHLDRDYARAETVRSIIDLSRKLNMEVVAEGIETIEEFDRLRAFQCDMVQGFLFSRPMDAEGITQLLMANESHVEPVYQTVGESGS